MTAHNGIRVRLAGGPRVITDGPSELFRLKPQPWTESALCREIGVELFVADTGESAVTRMAKTICNGDVGNRAMSSAFGVSYLGVGDQRPIRCPRRDVPACSAKVGYGTPVGSLMTAWAETEPDVIARILEEHHVRDSGHVAQRVHSALIRRRLLMLTEALDHRTKEGLV